MSTPLEKREKGEGRTSSLSKKNKTKVEMANKFADNDSPGIPKNLNLKSRKKKSVK